MRRQHETDSSEQSSSSSGFHRFALSDNAKHGKRVEAGFFVCYYEINAPRGRTWCPVGRTSSGRSLLPAGHVGADRSEAETAGIRFDVMSTIADPNPTPSLASET